MRSPYTQLQSLVEIRFYNDADLDSILYNNGTVIAQTEWKLRKRLQLTIEAAPYCILRKGSRELGSMLGAQRYTYMAPEEAHGLKVRG